MDHRLAMQIYQSISDVCELWELTDERRVMPLATLEPYKLEPICIRVLLDVLVDVPIFHPLRSHRKFITGHRRSQQWQHIRMAQRFPRHHFLTEPLHKPGSVHRLETLHDVSAAYVFYFVEVTGRVYPKNFDGDTVALVLALPHIGIATAIQRVIRWVVTKWDLH